MIRIVSPVTIAASLTEWFRSDAAGKPEGLLHERGRPDFRRLAELRTWLTTLATSLVAWSLPGVAFWGLASVWIDGYDLARAERVYTSASLAGAGAGTNQRWRTEGKPFDGFILRRPA